MENANILVPIDFSELSRTALQAANQWCRLFAGHVTPFHAYEAVTNLDGFQFYGPEETVSGNMQTIAGTAQNLLDEFACRDVEAAHLRKGIFVTGNPAYAIAKASMDFNLIVISSHGRSGLSQFLLGSVTEKLVVLSPIPVLVIRGNSALLPLDRILVLTDLSLNSETAFSYAKEIAMTTGSAIDLLYVHVCDNAQIATDTLQDRLQSFVDQHFSDVGLNVEAKILLSESSAYQGVYQFLQNNRSNLIVMATAGKSGIEQLLLGSTTAQIIRGIQTSVLLVTPDYQRELRVENLKAQNYL